MSLQHLGQDASDGRLGGAVLDGHREGGLLGQWPEVLLEPGCSGLDCRRGGAGGGRTLPGAIRGVGVFGGPAADGA